jgi:hypothetical protein
VAITRNTAAIYEKSMGINLNLTWRLIIFLIGRRQKWQNDPVNPRPWEKDAPPAPLMHRPPPISGAGWKKDVLFQCVNIFPSLSTVPTPPAKDRFSQGNLRHPSLLHLAVQLLRK